MTNTRYTLETFPRLTAYVRKRMAERNVSMGELVDTILSPTITEPSPRYGRRQTRFVKGDLVAVVDDTTATVVTLLFRRSERWTSDDMANR